MLDFGSTKSNGILLIASKPKLKCFISEFVEG